MQDGKIIGSAKRNGKMYEFCGKVIEKSGRATVSKPNRENVTICHNRLNHAGTRQIIDTIKQGCWSNNIEKTIAEISKCEIWVESKKSTRISLPGNKKKPVNPVEELAMNIKLL